MSLLHPPLLRDPLRQRFGRRSAAGVAAGLLDVGGGAIRLALAGVDAAIARVEALQAQRTTPSADRRSKRPDPIQPENVADLIYELLDAHDDTAQIAGGQAFGPEWDGHLEYLRALQRKGRETLAHVCLEQTS